MTGFNKRVMILVGIFIAMVVIHIPGGQFAPPHGNDWLDFAAEPIGAAVFIYWFLVLPSTLIGHNNTQWLRVGLVLSLLTFIQGGLDEFFTHSIEMESLFEVFEFFSVFGLVVISLALISGLRSILQQNKALGQDVAKYRQQTLVDALTGIANRKHFDDYLEKSVAQQDSFALMLIDIDHFKSVNDTYGHPTGDKVIQDLASVLQTICQSMGQAFRYGGEEFAVIVLNKHIEQVEYLAEAIRISCERTVQANGEEIAYTVSVGGTVYKQGMHKAEFIERADKALYQSKNNGRNCCTFIS